MLFLASDLLKIAHDQFVSLRPYKALRGPQAKIAGEEAGREVSRYKVAGGPWEQSLVHNLPHVF